MRNINSTLLSKSRTSIFIAHRCVLAFPLRLLLTDRCSFFPFLWLSSIRSPRSAASPLSPFPSLKTIADAELIIVLADGRVAEQGTHKSLMAAGGTYATMWKQQASSIYDEIEEDLELPEGEVVAEGEVLKSTEGVKVEKV
jgi:ATP-binding cassette subfamily B (MDR/TAP) protein 7